MDGKACPEKWVKYETKQGCLECCARARFFCFLGIFSKCWPYIVMKQLQNSQNVPDDEAPLL